MKKLILLTLVLLMSGCSQLTEPVTEHTDKAIEDVTIKLDEAEKSILTAINELEAELTKEPTVVVEEVVIKVSEYDVCVIGSVNGVRLLNATVTEKPFSNNITIEYDGEYGRNTSEYDKTKIYIECKTTFGG